MKTSPPSPANPQRERVTITYLKQVEPPRMASPPPPAGKVALLRAIEPSVKFYRYLFDAVGGPHRWVSRRYMDDETLLPIIHSDDVEIYVLYKDGWPVGFGEFDLSPRPALLIRFFGLVPEVQGQRLGAWFFSEMLAVAWAKAPNEVLIETCSADSPAALRLYQRMGFNVYDQGSGVIEWRG